MEVKEELEIAVTACFLAAVEDEVGGWCLFRSVKPKRGKNSRSVNGMGFTAIFLILPG